jgi:hypothetical protein
MERHFDRSTAFFPAQHVPVLSSVRLPNTPGLYDLFGWHHALLASRDILVGAKMTGFAIWQYADKSGYCWPNQTEIASARGLETTKRISQQVKELKDAGFLTVGKAHGNGKWRSNNYQLHLPTTEGTN